MTMKRLLIAMLALSTTLAAQGKEEDRLRACATVVKEVLDIPDNIPKDLLERAECVIVFPSVKKFALGVGGSYGRGAALGVPTPIMSSLYAVLKLHAAGPRNS